MPKHGKVSSSGAELPVMSWGGRPVNSEGLVVKASPQYADETVYTCLVLRRSSGHKLVYRKVPCMSLSLASVALTLSVIPQPYGVLYIPDD